MEERVFWLAWSQITGIGPILLQRLHWHFGSLQQAWTASIADLIDVEGFGSQTVEAIALQRLTLDPPAFLEKHEQENPCFWTPADPDYPRILLEVPDPPPVLYYRGVVEPQENAGLKPTVAIVGTRDPSDYGRRWTRRLSAVLVQNGFTVVSGLAEGIDTEAHRTCVGIGGRNIAVLGTGVDLVYPWSNRSLYQQVLDCGLAISEYPAGTQPDRVHFPRRNRIIAGLCRAVLILEAPARSGALITATLANEYGRDIYALPGSLDNGRSLGCLRLIDQGARMILGEKELLETLGNLPQIKPTTTYQTQLPLDLEPELAQILQVITDLSQQTEMQPIQFDHIVQTSGLMAGAVSSALLQLELLGLIAQQPGMRYQRC